MNEELQKQLAEMLAKLMASVESGAAWTGDQIPLLVQEKIAYGRVIETSAFFGAIALLVLSVAGFRWHWKAIDATELVDTNPGVFMAALCGGLFGFAMALMKFNAVTLVWFAPRLYIVEWLRTLIR